MIKLQNYRITRLDKKGFTLADALVALVVIGVVAAMAIPALLSGTNEAEYKTAWRKAYAELSQAYNKVLIDHAGDFTNVCTDNDNDCLKDQFKKYLSYTKECNNSFSDSSNNCIYDTSKDLSFLTYSPNGFWLSSNLVLKNGNILIFRETDGGCDNNWAGSNVNSCGVFIIDINGFKKPNKVGKDLYMGWITKDRIYPGGALDENNAAVINFWGGNSCIESNPSAQGWGCSLEHLIK